MNKTFLFFALSLALTGGCASEEDVLARETFKAKEWFHYASNCRERCGGEQLEPINYPTDLTELRLLSVDLESKFRICDKFCIPCQTAAADKSTNDEVADSAALGAFGGVIAGEALGAGARLLLK